MKKAIVTLILTFFTIIGFAQTNPNHVRVNGYYKSDGTYVKPHYRTAPNSTNGDNFSTLGNVNPYTLKPGWIPPDNNYSVPNYNANNYNLTNQNPSDSGVYTSIKYDGQLWREPNQFKRIRSISKGTRVKVIGYEEGFWKVISNGTIGYIYDGTINTTYQMDLLKEKSSDSHTYSPRSTYPANSSSYTTNSSIYTTIKNDGQLWREPNQFKRIRSISKGTRVKVIGYEEGFWKVISNGTTGYIYDGIINVTYQMRATYNM